MPISTYKYQFHKIGEKFVNDRRSVKIGIWKSIINILEKYLWRSFLSKATGNSPKILLKMNFFTNIFQGFQTTDLQNSCFEKHLSWEVFLVDIYLFKFNTVYKVNNKDTRATSFDVFLASFMLTSNKFYLLINCFYCWLWAVKFSMGRGFDNSRW